MRKSTHNTESICVLCKPVTGCMNRPITSKHIRLYFLLLNECFMFSCICTGWKLCCAVSVCSLTRQNLQEQIRVSLQVCSAYPADAPFEVLLNEAGPSPKVVFGMSRVLWCIQGRLSQQWFATTLCALRILKLVSAGRCQFGTSLSVLLRLLDKTLRTHTHHRLRHTRIL